MHSEAPLKVGLGEMTVQAILVNLEYHSLYAYTLNFMLSLSLKFLNVLRLTREL